ncbi:MAG: ABC transporter ATP-binding protein [Euryarchaeota archaeon]|nr:ABC transporter ATP-binding protein [Euryarchaeota archaeon]
MKYAIQTRGLTREFDGFVAVDKVDLDVPLGSIYGYIGLNGAGKTTTIRMLTTLVAPTRGKARVLGHDIVSAPLAVRAQIGLVGDDIGASRLAWTPREYLGYFARLHGIRRPHRLVEETLDLVDVDAVWRGRALVDHSTGMQRRVEVARALLGRPRVLFLDEPTRGLDLPAKRATWDMLLRLAKGGVTIFLSSHEVAEIRTLCSRLAVIAEGRLVYEGPVGGLGDDPVAFETALLGRLGGRDVPKRSSPARRW